MRLRPFLVTLCAGVWCVSAALAAPIKRSNHPWFGGAAGRPKASSPERKADPPAVAPREILDQTRPDGKAVVQQALKYKGTPYRFGGTSKHGVDCSGLVQRVWYDLHSNKLPRASASLYKKGTPVKLSELQPGDLVFFKNTYKRGISHVGVYAGQNKFIHASSKKGVTVTKFSDPYYQLRYAGARRLY